MDRLDKIASGFIEAKILMTGGRLGVFDLLKGEGRTAAQVREALDGEQRGVEILLDALVAMGILVKDGDLYRNDPEYEPHLLEDSPDQYLYLLRHRNRMFRRWAHLEERVLGVADRPEPIERAHLNDPMETENFIRAMFAVGHQRAASVAERIDLAGVRTLADVGGGPGHFLVEFLRRSPEVEPYLVDLPLTLEVARKVLADSPLFDRIRFVAWDIYADGPPDELPPLDLVFLSQVVHSESAARNRDLFRRLASVLSPGGRLVVRENTVEADRSCPTPGAIFAVNMLAMTDEGRTYTEEEIADWGAEFGLAHEGGERTDERSYLVFLRRTR